DIEPNMDDTVQSIVFPSSVGRLYQIEGRTNLVSGSWEMIRTGIPGTGNHIELLYTNTGHGISSAFWSSGPDPGFT
ncbi:MAG: hypothetical protein AAF492_14785, partial [Verrucomicrobiota bacterium]